MARESMLSTRTGGCVGKATTHLREPGPGGERGLTAQGEAAWRRGDWAKSRRRQVWCVLRSLWSLGAAGREEEEVYRGLFCCCSGVSTRRCYFSLCPVCSAVEKKVKSTPVVLVIGVDLLQLGDLVVEEARSD